MSPNLNVKRLTTDGVMLAFALIVGMVENMLPPIFPLLPFARLGLSNIVIVFLLVRNGFFDSAIVLVLKCVLLAVFVGNISMVIYSLSGGFMSLFAMQLLILMAKNSLAAISAVGGAVSNLVQVFVACLVINSLYPLVFLCYLLIFGMLAGAIVGVISQMLIRYLSKVK